MMTYTLQFKTGDAEIRALRNLPKTFFEIPGFRMLIEITRGRKSSKDRIGDFHKRIKSLEEFISPLSTIFFDITSDDNLANEQIDNLYNANNGYQNWQQFFSQLNTRFPNSIPMLLYNDSDNDYTEFKKQIKYFSKVYHKVGYKIYPNLGQKLIQEEIHILQEAITPDTELYIFYEQGYIVEGLQKMAVKSTIDCLGVVSGILSECPKVEYIFTSTSFPDSVTSLSGNEEGFITCSEISTYENIEKNCDLDISYSDYGSVTPKRNDDTAFYGRGWTPRIDFPNLEKGSIFYYRKKREHREYADVYTDVAQECINHSSFPEDLECWGISTIKNAANGYKPGATPSFWLSVRMNIFVTEQLRRLHLVK